MDDQQPDWRGNGSRFLASYGVDETKVKRMRGWDLTSDKQMVDAVNIAKGLVENFSLRELELHRCGVTTDGAIALSQALAVNKYLEYVGLARNSCAAHGGEALAEAIKVNQTLKTLDLTWTDATDETAAALAESLMMNNSLQRLLLDRNSIGCDGASALATALIKNTKLKHLGLSNNRIRAAGFSFLGQAVARSAAITTLDISMNGAAEPGMFSFFHALALTGASTLSTVNVSYNCLGDSCAMAAVFVRRTSKLRELCLESCGLTNGAPFKTLCEAIAASRSLVNVSLAANDVKDAGLATLANAFVAANSASSASTSALRYLDLTEVGATKAALPSITSIATSTSVTTLHLSRNDLSGGGKEVGQLLSAPKTQLTFVSLGYCKLATPGFDAMIGHLKYSSTNVTGLSLRGNGAGDNGIALLLPVAIHHGKFTYLDVSGNNATSATVGRLNDVFEANPGLAYIAIGDVTIVHRGNMYLPWSELDGKQPGSMDFPMPPFCDAPWDVNPSTFAPTLGFATYSVASGSAVKRQSEGWPSALPSLLDWAGKPTKHITVWRDGRELARSAPDLRSPLFNNHITTATSVEFENNLGGLLTSDDQLRREFNRLDLNGNGYLEANEMKNIYQSLQHFGVRLTQRDLDRILTSVSDGRRIDFDQFCVLYLKLVRA